MGVVNRPRDWSFMAHITGRFRLKGQGSCMPAEVWQYNSAPDVARIFHMRIDFAGVVPMVGRDTYLRGRPESDCARLPGRGRASGQLQHY